jgi:hypothetical protein
MRDPSEAAIPARPTRGDVGDQIGRTVSSLWLRRSGVRPASVSTEYVGDVVRCQIRQGDPPHDLTDGTADDRRIDSIDSRGYQHQAQAAVERLTGRRVLAFIAKGDENELARNVFILDSVRVKN